jgi:hypothetical protein
VISNDMVYSRYMRTHFFVSACERIVLARRCDLSRTPNGTV